MRRHAEDAWPSFETRRWRVAPQDEDGARIEQSEIPARRDDARFPHFASLMRATNVGVGRVGGPMTRESSVDPWTRSYK
jgi:hypothetical protein